MQNFPESPGTKIMEVYMWVVLYPECRILKTPAQLTLRATDFAISISISRVVCDVVSRCFPRQTILISGSLTNLAGVFRCLLQYTWWNLCRSFLCTNSSSMDVTIYKGIATSEAYPSIHPPVPISFSFPFSDPDPSSKYKRFSSM